MVIHNDARLRDGINMIYRTIYYLKRSRVPLRFILNNVEYLEGLACRLTASSPVVEYN